MTNPADEKPNELRGVRVLGALNGVELFGHERGNIEVFKALRSRGAEVCVAVNAREGGGAVAAELIRLGFDTFELPFGTHWSIQFVRWKPSLVFTNLRDVVRCSWRFHRALRAFRPTHVHIGSPLVYSYISLALMASDVRLVYRVGDQPPLDSPFNLRIWKLAMRRTSRIVANSDFVRRSSVHAMGDGARVELIYSAPPSRGSERPEGPAVSSPQPADLVYVGAVAEEKGLLPLVDAFARVALDYPKVDLEIVGESANDPPFRERLQKRIAELQIDARVRFAGHVDDPSPHYRRAAAHLLPSICEDALPNVVLEAKREGTPSVVFSSGGLPELVLHKVNGYVCESRTADSLAAGLRWILADADRLKRLSAAARADYEVRFGPERFANEWSAVYRLTRPEARAASEC